MAFIHQDLGLVEWMTVAENVALGMGYPRRFGLIDWRAAHATARRVMARVGCQIDPARRVVSLTRAEKSLLAIGRALEVKARLLDEPSASLPMADVQHLFEVLRGLRAQGMAMVYVSHRLDEVMAISDRAAVLQLQAAASGNAGPISFQVQRGEVLGLVGLRGAGHEAISRALFGREPLSAGSMWLRGQPVQLRDPAQAIAAGVACVAGERLDENLAPSMTVLENLFPNPRLLGDRGLSLQRRRREQAGARALISRFDIKPPAAAAEVAQLSGGNQQKVVLARWFHLDKPLVVLEEPTAGVDVGAKRLIYRLLRERARAGTALVVVSTDFEEVATLCDRVWVFRQGLIAAELRGAQITVAKLLALAAGGGARPEGATERAVESEGT